MTSAPRATRIVHMTTVHRPFDTRIFHKECVSAAAAGYDVTLLQRGEVEQTVAGVRVLPLPSYTSRLKRMTLGVWRAVRLARRARADIAHFHDPELIWGSFLLKLSGVRVVYDIHENLHLDIAAKQWVPGWAKRPLGVATLGLEQVAGFFFDHVVAATDGIAQRFPARKTTLVRNSPILDDLRVAESATPFRERAPNMIYIGGLGGGGDVKGVDLMLNALAVLPDESPIRLLLGGPEPAPGFVDALKARKGGHRIDYLGYVDPKDLGKYYAQAIGALVLYPPMPNNIASEPVKLFEAMAAGVPTIISDFPLFREYIATADCGFALDPTDAAEVARRMIELEANRDAAEAMGARGRRYAETERNWSIFAKRLENVYRGLAPKRGGPAA